MSRTKALRDKRRKRSELRRRRTEPGVAPGTVQADPEAIPSTVNVLAYGPDGYEEKTNATVDDVVALAARWPVVWANVDGLGNAAVVESLGKAFGYHPLALEDVVNAHQRAKVEAYPDTEFIVLRMVEHAPPIVTEQVSFFLQGRVAVTFQERPGDCFESIRTRIRSGGPRLRSGGADYLVYALIDAIVDSFFPVLEAIGDRLETLEERVLLSTHSDVLREIHAIRRDLLLLRRIAWPLRDAIGALYREERPLIKDGTRVFLRDCHDHVAQLIDFIESYREVVTGLIDVHLSQQSNKLNDVMRVLTVMSTIFIPLSFVAGVYGMNFDTSASTMNMPELKWAWGYPFALGIMASIASVLVFWFRRKGWIGRNDLDLSRIVVEEDER